MKGKIHIISFAIFLQLILWSCGGSNTNLVETEQILRRTIVEEVNAPGKLKPETEVKISSDISGEIIVLSVKEGDFVKKGDLLARVQPQDYERALERAQTSLRTAKANLANARAGLLQTEATLIREKLNFSRSEKLYKDQSISTAEFEAAQANYKVAEATKESAYQQVKASEYQVESAEVGLREAKDILNRTNIIAPVDGTITQLKVELGERVVGTTQMAGTELMRVSNLNSMVVEADVNERDIIRIKNGDSAKIEVAALRNQVFKGVVTEIANSVPENEFSSSDKVTSFKISVRLLDSEVAKIRKEFNVDFKTGMTSNATIITAKKSNVLSVPVVAVTVRENDSTKATETVVFEYQDGKAKQRIIEIGIQDIDYFEVVNGLEENAEIIKGPYALVSKVLKDGDKVVKDKK
jgi:HlyD family secretion protein